MHRPALIARASALAVAALLACSFDATGLGDEVGGSPAPELTGADEDPASGTDAPGTSTTGDAPDGDGTGTGTSDPSTTTTTTTGPPASCGDDVQDPGEQCDAGPDNQGGKACTAECKINVCGDGYLGLGEACDPGPDPQSGQTCTPGCTTNICGDGYLGAGEICDDGPNNGDGQACTDMCTAAKCGDGIVSAGEVCDDGNTNNNDACLNTCEGATCGDGFLQPGVETCDEGPDNGMYGGLCNLECNGDGPRCGDGTWDKLDEQCDGNDRPKNVTCDGGCKAICNNKYADCNGNLGDGCEDLQYSEENCGMCNKACVGPGNFCWMGDCTY